MSLICAKDFEISVCTRIPRRGSADPLGVCRPAIQGYHDDLLNSTCLLDPGGIGPIWDGVFDDMFNTSTWLITLPRSINGGSWMDVSFLRQTNLGDPTPEGHWEIQIWSQDPFFTLIPLWIGYCSNGTGGLGSSPVNLTYTATPIGCGMTPAMVRVVAKVP